jgi:hypothetical protein
MDYTGILTRAAKLLWKHKVIYAYFLVSYALPSLLTLGMMGVFAFTFDPRNPEAFFKYFDFKEPLAWAGMLGLQLLFMLFSLACYTLGYAGTFKGAALAERGTDSISFAVLFQASLKHFLPLAAIFLVTGVSMFIVMLPAIVLGPFIFFAMLCLLPIIMAGRMAVDLLCATIVVDDLGLRKGLEVFWQIVQKYLGPLALMAFILLVLDFVANTAMTLPFVIVQPILMQVMFLNPAAQQDPSLMFAQLFKWFFIIMLFAMPIMLALQGLVVTYHNIATSLTYLAVSEKPVQPAPLAESASADL